MAGFPYRRLLRRLCPTSNIRFSGYLPRQGRWMWFPSSYQHCLHLAVDSVCTPMVIALTTSLSGMTVWSGVLQSLSKRDFRLSIRERQSDNCTLVLPFFGSSDPSQVLQPETLQATISLVVIERLWLAVHRWAGPSITTLSKGLQTMPSLVGIACPRSHQDTPFLGSALDRCVGTLLGAPLG